MIGEYRQIRGIASGRSPGLRERPNTFLASDVVGAVSFIQLAGITLTLTPPTEEVIVPEQDWPYILRKYRTISWLQGSPAYTVAVDMPPRCSIRCVLAASSRL